MITPVMIERVVATLGAMAVAPECERPDEDLHRLEDTLYLRLLEAIAEHRCTDPALDFSRWHA